MLCPGTSSFRPSQRTSDDEDASEAATTVDEFVVSSQKRSRERRRNEIEVTEPSPKRIARILDNLAKRSNTEFQDKALRILYIAAGFLDWRDEQREKDIASPLVLVPVELRRESTRDPYRLYFIDDEDIVINPSLTEKLRRDAGLTFRATGSGRTSRSLKSSMRSARQSRAPAGRCASGAVIGLFSFQKYVMYRDLLDNEERVLAHPVVASLAQRGARRTHCAMRTPRYRKSASSTRCKRPPRPSQSWMPMPVSGNAWRPQSEASRSSCKARRVPARARRSPTSSPRRSARASDPVRFRKGRGPRRGPSATWRQADSTSTA